MIVDLNQHPIAASALLLYATYWAIKTLRKQYPYEIYVIWLVFSFFFVIFLGIAIAAEYNGTSLSKVCGDYEQTCNAIYAMLTNVNDELILVAIFCAATIFPQCLAYVLSGMSGSATAPQYIWAIQQTAAWSFIKFSAGLAGILLAQPLAKLLYLKQPPFTDFASAIFFLAAAFTYALWHLRFWEVWDRFYKNNFQGEGRAQYHIRLLLKVHKFCTRHAPKTRPRTLGRRALIALVESDAIYEFVTGYREDKEAFTTDLKLE